MTDKSIGGVSWYIERRDGRMMLVSAGPPSWCRPATDAEAELWARVKNLEAQRAELDRAAARAVLSMRADGLRRRLGDTRDWDEANRLEAEHTKAQAELDAFDAAHPSNGQSNRKDEP